jgi:TRAP-type C4-dicarboxylate transport system permease small subunit
MLKTVAAIERTAGAFLLAVALLTFVMVILRKFFDTAIPDWYDFSRLAQGIAILWGIGCACYRGAHIQVDLVWDFLPRRRQRLLDLFATGVLLVFMLVFAFFATQAAFESRAVNLLTSDLRVPQWGFYLLGAAGVVAAAWATIGRLGQIWRQDERTPASTDGVVQ